MVIRLVVIYDIVDNGQWLWILFGPNINIHVESLNYLLCVECLVFLLFDLCFIHVAKLSWLIIPIGT